MEEEEAENEMIYGDTSIRPLIFEGGEGKAPPPGFNSVTISLPAGIRSGLNWKEKKEQAYEAVQKGYALMWNMELGLFNQLQYPLSHQVQFLSLGLAIEHFCETLWSEFKSHTIGMTLYRGSADFSRNFSWDALQESNFEAWLRKFTTLEYDPKVDVKQTPKGRRLVQLFCRDTAIDYLSLLANRLPESLKPYVFLDASSLDSTFHSLQLLNPVCYRRLHLALKGYSLPLNVLGWEMAMPQGYSATSLKVLNSISSEQVGVCLPHLSKYRLTDNHEMEVALHFLKERSIAFRLIPEDQLTTSWDGLNDLLYSPEDLTPQGKRQLLGFCAAGGSVVSMGELQGLPNEITLNEWLLQGQ